MSQPTDLRQAFITGLRDLACYLASHPAVPVPWHGTEICSQPAAPTTAAARKVDHFARQLGVTPHDDLADTGHYRAVRSFGPVGYRMTAISEHAMARHHAEMTYSGCVTPDPQPDTWT